MMRFMRRFDDFTQLAPGGEDFEEFGGGALVLVLGVVEAGRFPQAMGGGVKGIAFDYGLPDKVKRHLFFGGGAAEPIVGRRGAAVALFQQIALCFAEFLGGVHSMLYLLGGFIVFEQPAARPCRW
jgi:hypothetical protein